MIKAIENRIYNKFNQSYDAKISKKLWYRSIHSGQLAFVQLGIWACLWYSRILPARPCLVLAFILFTALIIISFAYINVKMLLDKKYTVNIKTINADTAPAAIPIPMQTLSGNDSLSDTN